MKQAMTEDQVKAWETDGLCPLCGGHAEENANEQEVYEGYNSFCYGCNRSFSVRGNEVDVKD